MTSNERYYRMRPGILTVCMFLDGRVRGARYFEILKRFGLWEDEL